MSATAVYEVANPSDPITFRATPAEAGVLAAILRASMMFVDPRPEMTVEEAAEERERIWSDADRIASYARAWDSFLIGSRTDRDLYEAAVSTMTPEQAAAYREKWHDARRSSMNDICRQSWNAAARIAKEKPSPPATADRGR